jgi:hypothetical protein
MHLIFRRLHSQQLKVPFRTFLRFGSGGVSGADTAGKKDIAAGIDVYCEGRWKQVDRRARWKKSVALEEVQDERASN